MEILMTISSVCGAIITILSLLTICFKLPSKWLKKAARESVEEIVQQKIIEQENKEKEQMESIENKMKEINNSILNLSNELKADRDATRAALRHSITYIYEKYFPQKTLPSTVKKDLCSLYEAYEGLSGNSYIHEIYEDMMHWDVN